MIKICKYHEQFINNKSDENPHRCVSKDGLQKTTRRVTSDYYINLKDNYINRISDRKYAIRTIFLCNSARLQRILYRIKRYYSDFLPGSLDYIRLVVEILSICGYR